MPVGFQLQVFTAKISVAFSRLLPEQYEHLKRAWSRCLIDEISAVHQTPSEPAWGDGDPAPEAVVRSESDIQVSLSGANTSGHDPFRLLQHRLASTVTLVALQECQKDALMLHAAGVADPHSGRTLALVGPSGTGKSTASTVLARTLCYISDETVAASPESLRIHPYPKPVSLISSFQELKNHVSPQELGLQPVPDGVEPALHRLVLLNRQASQTAQRPQLETLTHGEALIALVPQTSYFSKRTRPLANLLEVLDRTGGACSLTYSDAEQLGEYAQELLQDTAELKQEYQLAEISSPTQSGIRRAEVFDAVILDDEVMVLHWDETLNEDRLLVLAGIAPVLWQTASGVSFDALIEATIEAYGAPPGPAEQARASAEAAVTQALNELVSAGVIIWE